LPPKGDEFNLAQMEKVSANELDWREIAQG
jgi:hypothetical protein